MLDHLKTVRHDAAIEPKLMADAMTVPSEKSLVAVIAPEALMLRALNNAEDVRVACFVLVM